MRAIRSRRVLTEAGVLPALVTMQNGVFQAIEDYESESCTSGLLDLGNAVVMPGLVDTHVHVNEPGRTDWEGFQSATKAAAAGGITTLVDMPLNCSPVTTSAAAFQAKLDAIQQKMWVDCGFWGGVVPDSLDDLPGLLEAGVLGVKSFLIDSGLDEFPPVTESHLSRAMPLLTQAQRPYLIHAELDGGEAPGQAIARSYESFLASRPKTWETRAIDLMIDLSKRFGTHVHIVHLSNAEALGRLRRARQSGLKVTVETCPHYLVLAAESIAEGSTLYKCCPPIRESANGDLLWKGLVGGDIDAVVSDHSPCLPSLKCAESGDLERAWGGIASLQLGLPLIWSECRNRGIAIESLADWMCIATAQLAGLGHRKGRIAVGYDADLVVWDPDRRLKVEPDSLHHRHKLTPYMGRALHGAVMQTWLRGELVYDQGHFQGPIGKVLLA